MNNKIIKLIAIICCLWVTAQYSHAQFVGVKAGAGYHADYMAGVTFEYFLNHHFSLTAAATYYAPQDPLKDYYNPDAEGFSVDDRNKRLGYVSIPIMLEYKYLLTNDWRIYLGAGPAINLMIKDANEALFAAPEAEYDSMVREEKYKSAVPSAVAVVGVEYKNFRIGVQYDQQFSNITSMDTDNKVKSIQLSIGFRFGGNNNFRKTSNVYQSTGY